LLVDNWQPLWENDKRLKAVAEEQAKKFLEEEKKRKVKDEEDFFRNSMSL